MICINCGAPAESLFVTYSKNHIKLTICPNCNKTVDKYIEYDQLLVFINLILLKPEAYRHTVYNVSKLEALSNGDNDHKPQRPIWFLSKMNRIRIIMLTFEVYLTWVYEEKIIRANNFHRSQVMIKIFSNHYLAQYFYFLEYCILDQLLLKTLSERAFSPMISVKDSFNAKHIISYTILLAYGARLFPILMLIWPYDSLIPASVIKWISSFYVIEGLRIITNSSYQRVVVLFALISLIKIFMVNIILSYLLIGYVDLADTSRDILHQIVLF